MSLHSDVTDMLIQEAHGVRQDVACVATPPLAWRAYGEPVIG